LQVNLQPRDHMACESLGTNMSSINPWPPISMLLSLRGYVFYLQSFFPFATHRPSVNIEIGGSMGGGGRVLNLSCEEGQHHRFTCEINSVNSKHLHVLHCKT
jgi:hypothetical protein